MNVMNDDTDLIAHSCADVRRLLPSVATVAALGHAPAANYQQVMQHLQTCSDCLAEYDELCRLTEQAYDGLVEPVQFVPVFSLPALDQPPTPPPLADQIRYYRFRFTQAFVDSFRTRKIGLAARGNGGEHTETWLERNIHISIEVFDGPNHANECSLRIHVDHPDADPLEQPSTTVIIETPNQTWKAESDAMGYVQFNHIPLADLPTLLVEVALNYI